VDLGSVSEPYPAGITVRRALLRRAGYGAAVFLSAAGGLVLEIVAGRMLAPYVGMSLYSWTAIIAVVLAGFSAGHWIGGLIGDGEHRRAVRRVAVALLLAALAALASLVLIRVLSPMILGAGLDPIVAIVLLSGALFLLPSLFVGIVSPILTRLAIDEAPAIRGRVLGQMYALGAVGSIAWALAAGYLFISWIGTIGTVVSVAAGYAELGTLFALAGGPLTGRAAAVGTVLLAAVAALGTWGAGNRAFVSPCLVESDYYCIRVVDFSAESGRASALMVLDHMGHGINDRDDPTRITTSYVALTDRLLELRLDPAAGFAAFFIGGGAYTLPRAWLAAHPGARLTVAEVDPAVTRVAREHLWFAPSPRLELLHRDARAALQGLPPDRRFDVMIGDAYHDFTVPTHLVSAEFMREVARRLNPGGFFAGTAIDSGTRPEFLFSLVKTLRSAFAAVEVWADVDQLYGGGRMTYLVVAGDRASPTGRLGSEPDGRRWARWPSQDLDRRIAASGAVLLTDDYAPVDRLLFPVLREDL
jgi:spermidine synthase